MGHSSLPAGESLYPDLAALTIWPRFDAGEVPNRTLARAERHASPSWVVSFGHVSTSIFVAGAFVKRAYVGSSGEGATVTPADFPQMGKLVLGSTMDCPQRLVAHLLSRSPTLGSYMSRSVKETVFMYAICMSPERKNA
jgi:hypothetical protein